MTNDEMDRAIAEFCGWKRYDINLIGNDGHFLYRFKDTDLLLMDNELPKYSSDLNLMHEAEQALFTRCWDARDIFIDRLCRIMDPVNGYRKQSAIDIIDATAEQHAKAFIETIESIKTT